jgi:hypothetical protein
LIRQSMQSQSRLRFCMDARVKPAHDERVNAI